MAIREWLSDEIFWYFACIAWFIFVGVNVNTTLGLIYYGFPTTAILLAWADKKRTIKFDKDGKWFKALISAGIIYIGFIVINSFLIPLYQEINIGEIIKLLGATAPALAQSKILNFITFAGPVAFVETMAVIRYFDYLASKFNIRIDRFSLPVIILIVILAFGFMWLHITGKGITNSAALILVFVMMVVSLVLAVHYQEGKQAALFHIYANTIASLTMFGILAISKFILPLT